MEQKQKGIYYGWWIVVCGFFIMALVYASIVSCPGVYVKPVTAEMGVERAAFSLTTSCRALGLIFGSLFWGKQIQKRGLKPVMLVCCVVVASCIFGFSLAHAMWQFYILGALMGFAMPGITSIPVAVLINNWFGAEKKGFAMSVVFAGSGLGGMLLTMVFSNIIATLGWRRAYQINALTIAIVVIPAILFVVSNAPAAKGLTRLGDAPQASGKVAQGMSFAEAKRSSSFWLLFASLALMAVVSSALLNHQIPYFTDIGISPALGATLGAVAVGSLTIGKLILGGLLDKTGLKWGAFLGNLALVFALLALVLCTSAGQWMVYPYILFYCLGASVPTVAPPIFVNSLFGDRDYARLIGLTNVAIGIGAIFGPTMCAKLFDVTGSYTAAWLVFIVIAVVIVFLQFACMKAHKSAVPGGANQ